MCRCCDVIVDSTLRECINGRLGTDIGNDCSLAQVSMFGWRFDHSDLVDQSGNCSSIQVLDQLVSERIRRIYARNIECNDALIEFAFLYVADDVGGGILADCPIVYVFYANAAGGVSWPFEER